MADGVAGGPDLPHTPTWATAVVITMMMILSGFVELMIYKSTQWIKKPRWSWLSFLELEEPLEKIKTEFMLTGFMSILINWFATPISEICIGGKAGHIILPCNSVDGEAAGRDHCREKGKVALTSLKSIHQLDTFMLVLPVVHVIYSLVAMTLARFRMKSWKKWESTAQQLEQQQQEQEQEQQEQEQHQQEQQQQEQQQHTTIAVGPELRPNRPEKRIMVFLRQFYQPMKEGDYRIMRQHFLDTTENFDFHMYITTHFKKDTKAFISISLPLRGAAMLTVLINIHGMGTLFLTSLVPLSILLVVGAKLVKVYVEMKFKGTGLCFWFSQPGIIRFLIRLALFENAFLMAHFLWAMGTSGLRNCYYKNMVLGITEAVLGIAFQIFCGWVTFPLYAILTKMPNWPAVANREANFDDESMDGLREMFGRPISEEGNNLHYTHPERTEMLRHASLRRQGFHNSSAGIDSETDRFLGMLSLETAPNAERQPARDGVRLMEEQNADPRDDRMEIDDGNA